MKVLSETAFISKQDKFTELSHLKNHLACLKYHWESSIQNPKSQFVHLESGKFCDTEQARHHACHRLPVSTGLQQQEPRGPKEMTLVH